MFQEEVGHQCYYYTNKVLECFKQLYGKVVTWMIALELYLIVLSLVNRYTHCLRQFWKYSHCVWWVYHYYIFVALFL